MKVEVDINEDQMVPYLTGLAKDQIWHINDTIKRLRNNYTDSDSPTFLLEDLQDFFATLDNINELIKYHGGEPIKVIAANVIFGHDLDGNKFE